MQRRKILNSPRLLELRKKRRGVFLKKIFFFGLFVSAIFGLIIYLSRLPVLQIEEIQVLGNKVADAKTIQATVEKELAGKYFYFFPKTNVFWHPKTSLAKKIAEASPRIKDAAFAIKDRQILEVSVTEREPKYIWCDADLAVGLPLGSPTAKEQECRFLDESGFMFDRAAHFSGEVYFKFYGELPPDFAKLIRFKETLKNMGLRPAAFYSDDGGGGKIFLSKSAPPFGPEIIFKIDSDLEAVADNLQTALATEPLKTNFKNKYASLEYIDLRFGNKVYYKFR